MKFNDGFWLLKHGVKPVRPFSLFCFCFLTSTRIREPLQYYALQVVQCSETGEGYDLQVSTRPIRHRGDTLGGPLLSAKLTAPSEGIIGVKLAHSIVRKFFQIEIEESHLIASVDIEPETRYSLVP